MAITTTAQAPLKAISIPGENESNAVLDTTGAIPHRATTATRTKNEIILISLFIAELL